MATLPPQLEPGWFGGQPSWFWIFYAFAFLSVACYLGWFVYGVRKHGWRNVSLQSLSMYIDGEKTLIASSGIATAILVAASSSLPPWLVQRSIILLVASIVWGVLFLLVFTRSTEAAISRARQTNPVANKGEMKGFELTLTLGFGGLSLLSFMWGFLHLAQAALYL